MVTQVPLDCMHLVELGVMRKFLQRLYNNKVVEKLTKIEMETILKMLTSRSKYIPKEFARKPRTLLELPNWKATEYRQFLLYTGIVALKDTVRIDQYYAFFLLHCAYTLLCSEKQLATCMRNDHSSQIFNQWFVLRV